MENERLMELLKTLIENLCMDEESSIVHDQLIQLGFTEDELKLLYNF